jgi:hypothetical protein
MTFMRDIRVEDLDCKSDERGWLIEVLGGKSLEVPHEFGQIHVSVNISVAVGSCANDTAGGN